MTGLPRRSLKESGWAGVTCSVKSGAVIPGDRTCDIFGLLSRKYRRPDRRRSDLRQSSCRRHVKQGANDLEVRVPTVDQRPDPEIARDAVTAIKNRLPISSEHIKVVVKNGWLTLEGEV